MAAGCGRTLAPAMTAPTPAASAMPLATPTPGIAAQATGAKAILFGKNGERVAALTAASAGFDPTNASKTLVVKKGKATLYDREKADAPAAEMTADFLTADREKRLLTATGNARIRSLTQKEAPTIRADKMIWSFDARTVNGSGNVLLTAEPNLKMPGNSFQADTRLQTFRVESDGQPATGGNP